MCMQAVLGRANHLGPVALQINPSSLQGHLSPNVQNTTWTTSSTLYEGRRPHPGSPSPEFLSFLSPFIGRFLGCISSHHRRLHYPWRNWRSTIRVFTLRPSYLHLGWGFHVPLSRLIDIVVAVRALHPGAAASRRITSLPPTGNCSYIPFSPTR